MNAIKRFGSAMIVPVLMFAFFGIVLGFATLFKNPTIMGSLADQHTFWYHFKFMFIMKYNDMIM
ncbi:PTS system, arbutin-like IIBC component [Staphylococcus aureus]|nr:PTS system, arbutin-like IIBC component [Staphylococcus aureus]